jgi:formate hydrogenlyase subunit 6/NADH:ubiquinone oxidoreductase subunit I
VSFWDNVLHLDIFGGLKMTGRHFFRTADTVEYPEAARAPSEKAGDARKSDAGPSVDGSA